MPKKFKGEFLDLSAEIKPLISKLSLAGGEEVGRAMLTFIAARPGEGTSTVARSFALAFSNETGKKTLLIEDGGNDSTADNGIVELAAFGSDVMAAALAIGPNTFVARWFVSEQGARQSGRFVQDKAFWQSLYAIFDAIVIDAPSLQESSEGVAFAQVSTMTVLVVQAETTRKGVVENLRDTLKSVDANIVGIVMNKRKFYIPEKVYKRL